jgi:hypothetical protein
VICLLLLDQELDGYQRGAVRSIGRQSSPAPE